MALCFFLSRGFGPLLYIILRSTDWCRVLVKALRPVEKEAFPLLGFRHLQCFRALSAAGFEVWTSRREAQRRQVPVSSPRGSSYSAMMDLRFKKRSVVYWDACFDPLGVLLFELPVFMIRSLMVSVTTALPSEAQASAPSGCPIEAQDQSNRLARNHHDHDHDHDDDDDADDGHDHDHGHDADDEYDKDEDEDGDEEDEDKDEDHDEDEDGDNNENDS